MSFPRYPAYKDSGVEWLGEVPEHWHIERFKLSVESCVNGAWGEEPGNDANDVTCMRVADFDRQKLVAAEPDEPTIRSVSTRDVKQRILSKGDLLIEKSGGGEKQPVGTVVLYTGSTPAVCSNFVARMRLAQGTHSSFWRYAHHAAYTLKVNTKSIKQTSGIQNLDQQQYLDERAPFPPVKEQVAIATFLDRETAKIDALIAEQQRLIELLQEKRQAVISHAVTKGLNPDAPMKDSGVEWLGEVPKHWEVKQLRYVCKIQTGSRDTEEAVDDGQYPFFVRSQTVERINSYSCNCEAVLTAGDGAGVGKVFHYYVGPFDFHQRVYMLNEFSGIHGKLVYHFLKTNFFKVALQGGAKSTVDSLRRPMFTSFVLCIPPESEQAPLLRYVEEQEEDLGRLITTSEKVIRLLQERRSALISAAVTGQIDVRGLAPEASAA